METNVRVAHVIPDDHKDSGALGGNRSESKWSQQEGAHAWDAPESAGRLQAGVKEATAAGCRIIWCQKRAKNFPPGPRPQWPRSCSDRLRF